LVFQRKPQGLMLNRTIQFSKNMSLLPGTLKSLEAKKPRAESCLLASASQLPLRCGLFCKVASNIRQRFIWTFYPSDNFSLPGLSRRPVEICSYRSFPASAFFTFFTHISTMERISLLIIQYKIHSSHIPKYFGNCIKEIDYMLINIFIINHKNSHE